MKTEILVIGRNVQIMETVLRLINSQEKWHAVGALTDEEAMEVFSGQNIDLVLIGGGVNEESEQSFDNAFRKAKPSIRIVRHYGGGSGLLFNEILGALQNTSGEENKS